MKCIKKLKVLHVGGHYDQFRGGGNLRNVSLYKELSEKCDLYIIAYIQNGANVRRNIETAPPFAYLQYENNFFKQIFFVLKTVLFNKIDVIHTHNFRLALMLKLLLPFRKQVLEFHGIKEFRGIRGALFSFIMSKLNGFIALSSSLKEYIHVKYGVPLSKIETIINGYPDDIEVERIEAEGLGQSTLNVAYIGTLHDWQGVINFADAIQQIIKNNLITKVVKFNFIGNGNQELFELLNSRLQQFVKRGLVSFTGEISPDEVHKYWIKQDIIVMPRPSTISTETIVPLKAIDALRYGKLIVGSNVGGLTELLEDNVNAILYQKDNIFSFVEKLVYSIEKWDLLFPIRETAQKTILTLPTWEKQASRLILYYNKIAND